MFDIGISVQKHRNPHLAQKACAADDDESLAGKNLRGQERGPGSWCLLLYLRLAAGLSLFGHRAVNHPGSSPQVKPHKRREK